VIKEAEKHFIDALFILASAGPNVIIEPVEPMVQKAVDILKRMNSNYFDGISKIKANYGSNAFGFVESGKDKDPTILNINLNKLKGLTDPIEILYQTIVTIAHEAAHAKSFDEKSGFVGGESVAEAEERKVEQWLKANIKLLQDNV
jgi:hypothetical protein